MWTNACRKQIFKKCVSPYFYGYRWFTYSLRTETFDNRVIGHWAVVTESSSHRTRLSGRNHDICSQWPGPHCQLIRLVNIFIPCSLFPSGHARGNLRLELWIWYPSCAPTKAAERNSPTSFFFFPHSSGCWLTVQLISLFLKWESELTLSAMQRAVKRNCQSLLRTQWISVPPGLMGTFEEDKLQGADVESWKS